MKLSLIFVTALALSAFSMPASGHHKVDGDGATECHGNSCGDKPDNPNKGPGNNNAGGNGNGHVKNAEKPGHVKHGD